jgi:SulP family sulfate permease
MRRLDALAFLSTAVAVLVVNAILAVAVGCSFYVARYCYAKLSNPMASEDGLGKMAVGAR